MHKTPSPSAAPRDHRLDAIRSRLQHGSATNQRAHYAPDVTYLLELLARHEERHRETLKMMVDIFDERIQDGICKALREGLGGALDRPRAPEQDREKGAGRVSPAAVNRAQESETA